MKMDAECRNKILYIRLQGEMDEHGAAALRRETDKLIDYHSVNAEKAVFDLQGISFMDSTGIGFLIGRYKKFNRYGIPVYITNVSATANRILSMSGIYTLMQKI
jgi:stage II sporulation protein AA (anti-sigma F factor antagonist)